MSALLLYYQCCSSIHSWLWIARYSPTSKCLFKFNNKDTSKDYQSRHYETLQFSFEIAVRFITWSKKNNSLKLAVKNQQQLFWNFLANNFPKSFTGNMILSLGNKVPNLLSTNLWKERPHYILHLTTLLHPWNYFFPGNVLVLKISEKLTVFAGIFTGKIGQTKFSL